MREHDTRPFSSDAPTVVSILLCESFVEAVPSGEMIFQNVWDFLFYYEPMIVFGAIVVTFNGVREAFDAQVDVVTYPEPVNEPLGAHTALGSFRVERPILGTAVTTQLSGFLKIPINQPTTIDIEVLGNGLLLGARSYPVIDPAILGEP
jgi:hypothetical protein